MTHSTGNDCPNRVGGLIDLESVPLSLPGSRLVVRRAGAAIEIAEARYETDLADTTFVRLLAFTDEAERRLEVSAVHADRVEFGGGRASLTFAGIAEISVGGDPGVSVTLEPTNGIAATLALGDSAVVLQPGRSPSSVPVGHHQQALVASEQHWTSWMEKCPRVRPDLIEMTRLCWYVLGANSIDLQPGGTARRAVVPSLIGYVGLWQWDAYFIAVGLRHGDLELARTQLDLAVGAVGADGQLPDVVHDDGVLMSSDDLPSSDLVALARHCPGALEAGQTLALTKPPLTAWAITKLIAAGDSGGSDAGVITAAWQAAMFDVAAASQEWWYRCADADGDGVPTYAHPYSSGLDDSPIFDDGVPVVSADLLSYLVVQDNILADHAPTESVANTHRHRRDATMRLLLELWDPDRRRFVAHGNDRLRLTDGITGLIPLLTGSLPEGIVAELVDALSDPARFGTRWPIPTVAISDPDYSPSRMWRGPAWINTNFLVIEGLIASGRTTEAGRLAAATVALVLHGGGPNEYFDAQTGLRPATATTSFSWSAALFVDLAVRLSSGEFEAGRE